MESGGKCKKGAGENNEIRRGIGNSVTWTSRADQVSNRYIDLPTYLEVVAHTEIVDRIHLNNSLYRQIPKRDFSKRKNERNRSINVVFKLSD